MGLKSRQQSMASKDLISLIVLLCLAISGQQNHDPLHHDDLWVVTRYTAT